MLTADDLRFVEQFEACRVPAGGFGHRDHVRLCWIYLQQTGPVEVLEQLGRGLQAFAAAQGKPGLYHATITWAFTFLIHERLGGRGETWERFAQRNAELFAWKPSLLDRYYTPETLASATARAAFVLPDRLAAQCGRGNGGDGVPGSVR